MMQTLLGHRNPIQLGKSAFVWKDAVTAQAPFLIKQIQHIQSISPFRTMMTRRGPLSAAMTSCGKVGWLASPSGYAYVPIDPLTLRPWPAMDTALAALAMYYAQQSGFVNYRPVTCLINRYLPGTAMGMHVDADEGDQTQPIVAISLGLPALFRWGGQSRAAQTVTFKLEHGDVIIWGGEDRLRYHGIAKVMEAHTPLALNVRYALTFRYVAPANSGYHPIKSSPMTRQT